MMIPHVTSRSAMRFDMQRPECDTAMESLWDYLDAELAPGAARIVGAHFDRCERCGPRLSAAVRMKVAVRRASAHVRAPSTLRERVGALR